MLDQSSQHGLNKIEILNLKVRIKKTTGLTLEVRNDALFTLLCGSLLYTHLGLVFFFH